MFKSTIDYTNEKFLITNEPVMMLAMDVLQVLNKIGKITIIGKGESCPATVSVANIITQNILNGITKTEKISVDSEISDDGRLISTIEIIIAKISS
jgi:DNA-binding protein Alba